MDDPLGSSRDLIFFFFLVQSGKYSHTSLQEPSEQQRKLSIVEVATRASLTVIISVTNNTILVNQPALRKFLQVMR